MKSDETNIASVILKEAIMDKHVPDDFYSTTNNATMIFCDGRWINVENQRMDALIVVKDGGACCKKLRDIK
jgi:hypothetical protein